MDIHGAHLLRYRQWTSTTHRAITLYTFIGYPLFRNWGHEFFIASLRQILCCSVQCMLTKIAAFFHSPHKSYSGVFWVILSGESLVYPDYFPHLSDMEINWIRLDSRRGHGLYLAEQGNCCLYCWRVPHVAGQWRCLILQFSRVYNSFHTSPSTVLEKDYKKH